MEEEEKKKVEAKVIADSISLVNDTRLTTFEVTMHRFVLSEFNTHRVFSRNSASSRAIPIMKQINAIKSNIAMPVEFGSNQPGMQAGPPLTGDALYDAQQEWIAASLSAIAHAERLNALGVHKQVTNRLLEPFMWHKVIVTATDWDNFFSQRISKLAQPEIHLAAAKMKDALDASWPQCLKFGEWHTPYVTEKEVPDLADRRRVSAARCARVSYLTHDGVRDISADLDLYGKLISADPPHWSPLEHVATPFYEEDMFEGVPGNFDCWVQLRHF